MASVVDEESRAVTFLYKFKKGAYSRSHGVNVARIAGLPESILSRAEVIGSRRDLGDDRDDTISALISAIISALSGEIRRA